MTTVLKATSGWQLIDAAALWRYRDLLYFLSLRGIKIKYAQSILGVGWAVANPLIQALLFTLIFGNLAQLSSDGSPYILFSYTAMVSWSYFSGILTASTDSLVNNRDMIGKVYFPRLILPMAPALSNLVDFGVAFLVLIGLLVYYQMVPGWEILALPLLIAIMVLTSLGVGAFLAALAVQYRDIQYAMTFMVRLLMWTAPVAYSVAIVPESWRWVYALNPMVGVIEGMRAMFLNTREFPWQWVATGGVVSVLLFLFGCFYFRRMERHFADVA